MKNCNWQKMKNYELYISDCGKQSPMFNIYKFCPFCGKHINKIENGKTVIINQNPPNGYTAI